MLPPYLVASILSLAIPSLAAPLAVVPQSVRFLTNFPTSLQPATRMKLEWEGETPIDGWEVSVQPDLDGYEPLMSVSEARHAVPSTTIPHRSTLVFQSGNLSPSGKLTS